LKQSAEDSAGLVARRGCGVLVAVLSILLGAGPAAAQRHAGQYERADIEYGAQLYRGRCIACHGERGDAMPGANLASGRYRHAPTDRDLASVIRNGIPETAMIPTGYSDSEITAIIAYLRNMNTFDLDGVVQGDPDRGRELFAGKGECGTCHAINGRAIDGASPRFAPDLGNIGAARTAAMLERTLTNPHEGLLPINRPVRAVTRDGTVVTGRRLNEDTYTVQLIDERERLRSLEKADLRQYEVLTTATMPSYADLFTTEERADLVAYLLSLKGLN
jgi:putative heme-binding domain-containing protein